MCASKMPSLRDIGKGLLMLSSWMKIYVPSMFFLIRSLYHVRASSFVRSRREAYVYPVAEQTDS